MFQKNINIMYKIFVSHFAGMDALNPRVTMLDSRKTKEQLIAELKIARQKIAELEINERDLEEYCQTLKDRISRRNSELAAVTESLRDTGRQLQAVSKARAAAEKSSKTKSRFLADMSREIRTPLNTVIGFSQLLENDGSLTPEQAGKAKAIADSGRSLLNLINDILDLSRIDAGRMPTRKTAFCLHDLLDDLVTLFLTRTREKGLNMVLEGLEDVPRYVTTDESKLRQALIVLAENAVRVTQSGQVVLRVSGDNSDNSENDAPDTHGTYNLVVEVENSGPAVTDQEKENIFDPFTQDQKGKNNGDTGLGLAIGRKLIELIGGEISVESQAGKGSTFNFRIPVKKAPGLEKSPVKESDHVAGLKPGTGPFRILLVEDLEDNRWLLRDLLEPVGFEVKEAANGREGLEVFKQWAPHAVLMDLNMPVMDGYESARKIKATPEGKSVPIIAVTASAFEDSKKLASEKGFQGYIRKPFRPEELYSILAETLGLEYVFTHETDNPKESVPRTSIARKDLASLPEDIIASMRNASQQGNMDELRKIISRAHGLSPEAVRQLLNLAAYHDYEKLFEILA